MRKVVLSAIVIAIVGIMLVGCKKEQPTPTPEPTPNKLEAPSTYEFTRDGKSSVSLNGQRQRIDMHSQIKGYANKALSEEITQAMLLDLSTNKNNLFGAGAFFTAEDLNGSGKQVWNKISASAVSKTNQTKVYQHFKDLYVELEAISKLRGNSATKGNAGAIGGKRLVNENGYESVQLLSKSLMGALELDQIINHYLSDAKLNVDNKTVETDANYTAMEHHWDEAFGYTGLPTDPKVEYIDKEKASKEDVSKYRRFWAGYLVAISKSNAGNGILDRIYKNFIAGRTAIVNNDITARDEARKNIINDMQKACAIRAVFYLHEGADLLAKAQTEKERASAFHAISEGMGFYYSLRFTPIARELAEKDPTHSLENYFDKMVNTSLWETTTPDLLNVTAENIAKIYGFKVEDTKDNGAA